MSPRRVRLGGDLYHPVVPDGAVRVTRPTRWGNPYPASKYSRDEALALFRQHLADRPDLVARARAELAGKDLACWCQPDQDCHADILLDLANAPASTAEGGVMTSMTRSPCPSWCRNAGTRRRHVHSARTITVPLSPADPEFPEWAVHITLSRGADDPPPAVVGLCWPPGGGGYLLPAHARWLTTALSTRAGGLSLTVPRHESAIGFTVHATTTGATLVTGNETPFTPEPEVEAVALTRRQARAVAAAIRAQLRLLPRVRNETPMAEVA